MSMSSTSPDRASPARRVTGVMRGDTGEDTSAQVDALVAQDPGRQRRDGAVSDGGTEAPLRGAALAITAFALAMGTFTQVLDTTIANVSLPTIAGNLGASTDQSTWIITSFVVANGIGVPHHRLADEPLWRGEGLRAVHAGLHPGFVAVRHRLEPGIADRSSAPCRARCRGRSFPAPRR